MDPFLAGSQSSASPDAGQSGATDVSNTEAKIQGGVELGSEFAKAILPQFAPEVSAVGPLAMVGIHLGFALAHFIQHLRGTKQPAPKQA